MKVYLLIIYKAILDSLYIFVMGSIGILFIVEYSIRDLINEFRNQKGNAPETETEKPKLRMVKRDGQ